MLILEKSENIKLNSEKKSYRQPQLKEIGRVNSITKGGNNADTPLDVFTGQSVFPS